MNIFRLNSQLGRSVERSLSFKLFYGALFGFLVVMLLSFNAAAIADEESKKHKKDKKDDIMREISFLAKKLLDMSGEDSVTVKAPSVVKPFIGVCSNIESGGVKLTCITPDSQADKNGLKTGDLITSINDVSMKKEDNKDHMHAYWDAVKSMKTGDVLKLELIRAGTTLKIDVTVGSLSHPAYTLTVEG